MRRLAASASEKARLRRLLALFFVALAIPSAVLTWQAYSRLKWETFHRYQSMAEEMVDRIDGRLRELIAKEEARAFADYRFLVVEGAPEANYRQRSPLSGFPVKSDFPGLLGHFQVDADGRFTTPLLPDDPAVSPLAYGISAAELRQRQALRGRLLHILSQNGVATAAPTKEQRAAEAGTARATAGTGTPPAASEPAAQSTWPGAAGEAGPGETPTRSLAGERIPMSTGNPDLPSRVRPDGAREQRLAQAAFERLNEDSVPQRKAERWQAAAGNIGRADELRLDRAYDTIEIPAEARRPSLDFKKRVELDPVQRDDGRAVALLPPLDNMSGQPQPGAASPPTLVRMFQSEVDPFEFGVVDGEHFVLYRKVWRGGRRHIQGAVIERQTMLRELAEAPFRDSALAGMSRLGVVFDGDILSAWGGQQAGVYLTRSDELSGTLLYRGRLSTPLDRLELLLTVTRMPASPATGLVVWMALALGLVLSGGLVLMYRLGAKQLELNRQQQDFVSAVSHELKTPLTSIRMYSEMLREGWADESRKRSYYDFIHEESERLSRLISNVLQLARISRDELRVETKPAGVGQLMALVESKVATQVRQAGYELQLDCSDRAAPHQVEVDDDAFVQILINLVDNAIKFSARADVKRIDVGCDLVGEGRVEFRVRDHGPGIPRDQMKKIFHLFYRTESELTRETVGTGIGLALVHRLAAAMGGEVDVVNREPGAEFRVRFPLRKGDSQAAMRDVPTGQGRGNKGVVPQP